MAKQENRPIRQRAFYALQKENSLLRQMVADLEEELIKLRQQLKEKESMIMNLDTLKATLLTNSPDLKPSNKAKGLCIKCGQNALDNCYSEAGRREVAITGLCEKCFDKIADVDAPVTDQNSGNRERADIEEDDDNSILSTAVDSGISLSIADTDFDTPSSDTDTSSDFSGFDGGDSGGGGASGDF
jgi:hypothetical protein